MLEVTSLHPCYWQPPPPPASLWNGDLVALGRNNQQLLHNTWIELSHAENSYSLLTFLFDDVTYLFKNMKTALRTVV